MPPQALDEHHNASSPIKVTAWPAESRPRERLRAVGAAALSDAELVSIVLGSGCAGANVASLSQALLTRHGGLRGLARARAGELCKNRGIGAARASVLLACVELSRRLWARPIPSRTSITTSELAYHVVRGRFAGLSQERFVVLALDARNRLLSVAEVAQGTATSVEVHPRDVFAPLLRESAARAIVAHNHPSGDPEPSEDDRELTLRLSKAARLLGIPLLDHLIVGQGTYVSLADRGLIEGRAT
jgi:DNA repair protein RadC